MRIRLVLALFVALLGVFAGTPAQAAPPALRVLTFNVCGNVCRHGEVGSTSANVAYRIYKLNASVTMLQELCYTQFLGIRGRLAGYGYSAVFAPAATGGQCDNDDNRHGKAFGVAIVARGTLVNPLIHRLPSPYGLEEGRVVLASTVRLPGRTILAVTTHTAKAGPNLSYQLDALSRWLAPLAATRPVVFGGDLNTQPDSADLNGFYASFREANDDRMRPLPTFIPAPRKIDYIFGSQGHLLPRGVATAETGYSDHRVYLGVFR